MKISLSYWQDCSPVLLLLYLIISTEGAFNRCFKCRSRGDLGSCRDPFRFNESVTYGVDYVETVPCTSGWCGKLLDSGSNAFKDEEYGAATERFCLQRGPDDNEERCALTTWKHEKVYMCFCQGDLCNDAPLKLPAIILLMLPIAAILQIPRQ